MKKVIKYGQIITFNGIVARCVKCKSTFSLNYCNTNRCCFDFFHKCPYDSKNCTFTCPPYGVFKEIVTK